MCACAGVRVCVRACVSHRAPTTAQVISIRMGVPRAAPDRPHTAARRWRESSPTGTSGVGTPSHRADLDGGGGGGYGADDSLAALARVPDHNPPPAWNEGWGNLMARPDDFFDPAAARPSMPYVYNLAPLPARHFCSGHLFWEQQGMEPRQCASVHTTFVEGGNLGKLWRMRDAGLWLMDPVSHFAPPKPRYLTFVPPRPPWPFAPVRNAR